MSPIRLRSGQSLPHDIPPRTIHIEDLGDESPESDLWSPPRARGGGLCVPLIQYDTNSDATVSAVAFAAANASEVAAREKPFLARFDGNSDGNVTSDEALSVYAELAATWLGNLLARYDNNGDGALRPPISRGRRWALPPCWRAMTPTATACLPVRNWKPPRMYQSPAALQNSSRNSTRMAMGRSAPRKHPWSIKPRSMKGLPR